MRQPNANEKRGLSEANHAVARGELAARRIQLELQQAIAARDALILRVAEACCVAPDQPLDPTRFTWMERKQPGGANPLTMPGDDHGEIEPDRS